jgi:hypothetical protein
MSDGPQTAKPRMLAIAATPADAPRSVFRSSFKLNPELKRRLDENPGSRLEIRLPGEPGYGGSTAPMRGPAFVMRFWREDNYTCPHCQGPFLVAYGNPPSQARGTRNVAVCCPGCGRTVAVPIPLDVQEEDMEVRPGTSEHGGPIAAP